MMKYEGKIDRQTVIKGGDPVHKVHVDCINKYGPGNFSHFLGVDGSVSWVFETTSGLTETPLIDTEFVDAVQLARVNLCNMGAVKMQNDGVYVPLDPEDENGVQKCMAINRLEKFLTQYGRQTRR